MALADKTRADVLKEFGGAQFSTFKSALVELAVRPARPDRRDRRLVQDPGHIDGILADGSARAGDRGRNRGHVKDIVGFVRR